MAGSFRGPHDRAATPRYASQVLNLSLKVASGGPADCTVTARLWDPAPMVSGFTFTLSRFFADEPRTLPSIASFVSFARVPTRARTRRTNFLVVQRFGTPSILIGAGISVSSSTWLFTALPSTADAFSGSTVACRSRFGTSPESGSTTTTTVAVAPAAMSPSRQVTPNPSFLQLPWLGVSEIVFTGSPVLVSVAPLPPASRTWALSVSGPALPTVTVYSVSEPTFAFAVAGPARVTPKSTVVVAAPAPQGTVSATTASTTVGRALNTS